MIADLPRFLVRLGIALLMLGLSVWSALGAINQADIAAIPQSSDEDFRARMAAGLPRSASADWYAAIADRSMSLTPPDAELALNAYQRSLQLEDRNGVYWAAYADALIRQNASMDTIAQALAQSYSHLPIGDLATRHWRLRLAESVWAGLPDGLKHRIATEAGLVELDWLRTACPNIHADQTRP